MFVIMSKKSFKHRNHMATNTYIELQRAEVELEAVKHERDLAVACAAGYKHMVQKMEKEIEYYKNMYERKVKKNEALEKNVSFEHRNYCRVRVVPRGPRFRLP